MSDENSEMPLDPEPDMKHLVVKTVEVQECVDVASGDRFLAIGISAGLMAWEAEGLLRGGLRIIGRRFDQSLEIESGEDEDDGGA